jgi:hypothetical protein
MMKRILIAMACALIQVACSLPATSAPVPPTATSLPIPTASPPPVPATATVNPTSTPTRASTAMPTRTRTVIPATRRPTALPSPSKTASPSPIPGPAQDCANLAARGTSGIFIVDVVPDPSLVWDGRPHLFRVGVCNALSPSTVAQGRYKILLYFPASGKGHEESVPTPADLKPGMNIITVGPWVPGLENHRARCATKDTAEVEITYNDIPDPTIFRALSWPDGKTRTYLPVQCGGNFA